MYLAAELLFSLTGSDVKSVTQKCEETSVDNRGLLLDTVLVEFETGPAPFIRMSGLSLAFIPSFQQWV